jgi:hypothetical protein
MKRKVSLPVPALKQVSSVHFLTTCSFKIHFNIIPSSTLRSSTMFLPSGFAIRTLYEFLISLMRATCPTHILFDVVSLIVFGEHICTAFHKYTVAILAAAFQWITLYILYECQCNESVGMTLKPLVTWQNAPSTPQIRLLDWWL